MDAAPPKGVKMYFYPVNVRRKKYVFKVNEKSGPVRSEAISVAFYSQKSVTIYIYVGT